MKICFKCGQEKEITEFYRHPQMADGHFGKCKECAKKDATENRNKNIDRIREYDRQRGKLPHRRKKMQTRSKILRKLYPIKYLARNMVNNAIRDKKVSKPVKCEDCGKVARLHGHHDDYYKPLEVAWLCCVCHHKRHVMNAIKEFHKGKFRG
jgi:hypothetical protein